MNVQTSIGTGTSILAGELLTFNAQTVLSTSTGGSVSLLAPAGAMAGNEKEVFDARFANLATVIVVGFAVLIGNPNASSKRHQTLAVLNAAYEQSIPDNPTSLYISPSPAPQWAEMLEKGGQAEPDTSTYQMVADGLIDLVEAENYEVIGKVFRDLNLSNVSTDFVVMLLRLTYAVRHEIVDWKEFLGRSRIALVARGSDADYELLGLDSDYAT